MQLSNSLKQMDVYSYGVLLCELSTNQSPIVWAFPDIWKAGFCENLETKKLYKLIEYLYSLKRKKFIWNLNFSPITLLPKYLGFVSIVP